MIKDIMAANKAVTPNQKELHVLHENFPSCFHADGSFDMIRFSELLKDKVDISQEGYELKFLGKNYAKMIASLDTETIIVPDDVHNSLPENKNSENVYISGDNLDGLKHMLKSYAGEVKCIYIDPPYNTGTDGFVYNDKFSFTVDDLVAKLSIDEEQAQRILDLTNRGSASHSAWLMFMYPRLQLARDLLAKDGVIFISIDDNEQGNLKLMCDDIFGEQNFISCLSVENNPKGRKNSDFISISSEYCLIYSRKKELAHFVENVPKAASDMSLDENGNYVHNSGKRVLVGENEFNEIVTNLDSDKNYSVYYNRSIDKIEIRKENIDDVDTELITLGYQRYASVKDGNLVENTYTSSKLLELYEEDALDFAESKIYEKNYADKVRMKSQLVNKKYEAIVNGVKKEYSMELTTTGAGTYLKDLFNSDEVLFSAPKNIGFLKLLITLLEGDDFTVLDFFSGSSSTADAVMHINAQYKRNIKYIMVQLPEDLDDSLQNSSGKAKNKIKKMIKFLDKQNRVHTLDQIAMERIIHSARKIKSESPDTTADFGFKHYTLHEVSQTTLDKMESFDNSGLVTDTTVYDEFGANTVLTTWLVHDNYGFVNNCKMIDFAGYIAYWCDNHLYLINPGLTEDAIKDLIEKYNFEGNFNPQNIVLFGYNFNYVEMENLKTNVKILRDSEKNLKINLDIRY
ncbi:MAG: site-specific DNA-methyltransferase [Bacteroidales bacterium]|nr:site-specific DNA-methyltransferase [Lachnoclostridium sp.]MCM1383666.1 site-specific DNA-methyltransferase [Lachnoclostridium sp.]MCM1466296.1 site-specific DNA-methyltransferase [Bacteroidales bacterium]